MLIAARITEISEWIDRSDVREMKARNAAIGIRTIDYSKKQADAPEEAMSKIKTQQEAYAPADDVQVEIEDGYIKKRAASSQRGAVSFADTDEAPEDQAKLLAMFEYPMRNLKEEDEEETEKPAKERAAAMKKTTRKKTSSKS